MVRGGELEAADAVSVDEEIVGEGDDAVVVEEEIITECDDAVVERVVTQVEDVTINVEVRVIQLIKLSCVVMIPIWLVTNSSVAVIVTPCVAANALG